MSWHPAPPRAQAPWFKTITSLFQGPNVITRDGAGLNVVEAIADLAEAVRGLTEVVPTG